MTKIRPHLTKITLSS